MDIKRRKSREEKDEGPISKLPEDLLCHILSFLSTKDAALTSVLSKRWRNLFTLIPIIDLDDSLFALDNIGFRQFVNRVIALQSDSPLTKFSLVCHKGVEECLVNDWITKALRRGATDVTLMLLSPPSTGYSVPPSISLYGQNLVKLKLGHGELDLHFPGDFIFAKLRVLHLDSHFLEGFFALGGGLRFALCLSKCPVLEELILRCIQWHPWKSDSSVSSSTLKRLTIDCNIHFSGSSHKIVYFLGTRSPQSLSFDTPNLLYLNYSDFVACNYPLVKLDSLVEARLDVRLTKTQRNARDSHQHEVRLDATNLIMGIHNVGILELTSDTLEVIFGFCKTVPIFNNLRHLSIESNAERGWQTLPLLLTNSPNLHTLVFHGLHHRVTDGCGDACDCRFPSSSSSCLLSCPVKVLKILDFGATCVEMSLVKHFLKKLPKLEQLILSFDSV